MISEASVALDVHDAPSAADPSPALPAELERYLTPELWRRVSSLAPDRRDLLAAIRHLRSLRYLVSTYLPQPLVEQKLRRPVRGRVQGDWFDGSILFSDVSGFTALSERLAEQGPAGIERLTATLNRYFERMLEILAWSGGILLKFAGDALLAYFPALPDQEHVGWAVRAAQRMMYALEDFSALETPAGPVGLSMKVGLSSGRFVAASVGAPQRMEYVILGEAVARALVAEGHAEAGLIVVDETTARTLPPESYVERAPGFYAPHPIPPDALGEFEIRAEMGRARRTTSLLASVDELRADVRVHLSRLEALLPYLSPELAARVLDSAQQRQLESEYRPTTTLFVNFTGFEALLARPPLSVARVTRLLSAYFERMNAIVDRYGGIVSRIDPYSDGSKMLILFGAPVAHEDDPQRALHAALEMGEALAVLNARWRRALKVEGPGPLVRQRVGVTLGTTFAGQAGSSTRREYTVMGDDVNLAARLMSAARPGQVLLSAAVHAATREDFACTALPPIRVKGKREPVAVYRLDRRRDRRLARRLSDRGPLLGREPELAAGRAAIDALLDGRGAALIIQGAPGVGKSHLADILVSEALSQGTSAYLCECTAYTAASPYAAWVNVLHALAGIGYGDDRAARERKFLRLLTTLDLADDARQGALLNLLGLPDRSAARRLQRKIDHHAAQRGGERAGPSLFDSLGQKMNAPERTERPSLWQVTRERQRRETGQMWRKLETRVATREQARLYEAIELLLERISSQGPVILYFENAQWMDEASQMLLEYLAARLTKRPLLLLITRRVEEHAAAYADDVGHLLALAPLTEDGTRAMIASLLGTPPGERSLDELARAVHARSGGNPLFVEEMARWLRQAGEDARLDLSTGLRTSTTLQELVLSRVDRLPHVQRRVTKAASVVGDEFAVSGLQAMLDSRAPGRTLDEALGGLVEAHLALMLQASARYSFRQTLTREFVYQSLPFARRRGWHACLADHLAERHAEDLTAWAELLAHHALQAERWPAAARYLLMSADKALRRHAYAQAADVYTRALGALERLPDDEADADVPAMRTRAHLGLGDAALLTGDFPAALAAYEHARAALPASSDGGLHAELLAKQALVLVPQGRPEEAVARARRAAEASSNSALFADAVLAWLLWRAGAAQAEAIIDRVVARLSPAEGRWPAGVAALMDDLRERWDAARQAYRALDRPTGAALIACRRGRMYLERGDLERAETAYEAAADIWAQEGDARGLALAHYHRAELHARSGCVEPAREALQRALDLLATGGEAAADDTRAFREALDALEAGDWMETREPWRRYDDAFRISLLFRIGCPGGDWRAGKGSATQVEKENQMENLELLKNVSMFGRLSDEVLVEIESVLNIRSLEAGEVLFNQGDVGDGLFIIKTGRVAIYTPDDEHPGEERPIRIFEAGEVLGEMALIDDQPRSLSARALEQSAALVLSGDDFRRLLAQHETLALGVMAGLNERIRYTTDFLGEMREWVQRIAEGQYDRAFASDREYRDRSIAALAAEFAQMTIQVKQREEELRRQVRRLSIQIDQAKKERQVEEIVESDYFQSLRAQAKKLREQE